jgi:hypothetical protein
MKLFFPAFLICFIGINVSFGKCNLKQETGRPPFVVEAEIVKVYEPPMLWGESFIFSYQAVKDKVENVIKGENIGEEIIVKHAVIEGSLAADKNKTQLSPTYFFIGKKLILFLDVVNTKENLDRTKRTEFVSIDSDCSIYLKTENSKTGS